MLFWNPMMSLFFSNLPVTTVIYYGRIIQLLHNRRNAEGGGNMKKKIIAMIMAIAMVSSIAACSNDTAETTAAAGETAAAAETEQIPNPWTEVASADLAGEGAGIDSFILAPAGTETANGPLDFGQFRCTDGIAEAIGNIGAGIIKVRKGIGDDISGDYNTYEYTWDVTAGDITAHCSSNLSETQAQLVEWTSGDYSFVAYFNSQGDQDDQFGVDSDIIIPLVTEWVK